jgi:hypothetical protein
MQCRAPCAGAIHRLVASDPIECSKEGLVIEQAHLEHIAQKRSDEETPLDTQTNGDEQVRPEARSRRTTPRISPATRARRLP